MASGDDDAAMFLFYLLALDLSLLTVELRKGGKGGTGHDLAHSCLEVEEDAYTLEAVSPPFNLRVATPLAQGVSYVDWPWCQDACWPLGQLHFVNTASDWLLEFWNRCCWTPFLWFFGGSKTPCFWSLILWSIFSCVLCGMFFGHSCGDFQPAR